MEFRPLDHASVRPLGRLALRSDQEGLVTPAIWTIAEAGYEPGAQLWGIWEGARALGLLAMVDTRHGRPLPGDETDLTAAYLWLLLIDQSAQGKGVGTSALDHAKATARAWGFNRLTLTVVPKPGNARPFYERHGFSATGRLLYNGTETEMACTL